MNHYCTYFDSNYLVPGVAMITSLLAHEPETEVWVLALDDATEAAMRRWGDPRVQVVRLAELEAANPALMGAKTTRSRIEYYFTLSPFLPLYLFLRCREMARLTYIDADMLFFGSLTPVLDSVPGSIVITRHRFIPALCEFEANGLFNVGVISYRNDAAAHECLEWWRDRCLEWCHDRAEPGRFADQKYLDYWPDRFSGVSVLSHCGVNLAPWNWNSQSCRLEGGRVLAAGAPLVLFHFARFRPVYGWLWDSGQIDFAVMPSRLRNCIYGRYARALISSQQHLSRLGVSVPVLMPHLRAKRYTLAHWLGLLLFGGLWLRIGEYWVALGGGPWRRCSGKALAWRRARRHPRRGTG